MRLRSDSCRNNGVNVALVCEDELGVSTAAALMALCGGQRGDKEAYKIANEGGKKATKLQMRVPDGKPMKDPMRRPRIANEGANEEANEGANKIANAGAYKIADARAWRADEGPHEEAYKIANKGANEEANEGANKTAHEGPTEITVHVKVQDQRKVQSVKAIIPPTNEHKKFSTGE